MNKQTKKHKCIFLLFIIFIFLFSCNYLCKSFGYDKDIGPAISDSAGDWYVSFYGGKTLGAINPNTGTNFVFNDFTLNPTYKWCEWTYNNTTYVVVAAATQEL